MAGERVMSTAIALREHIEDYLDERQRLGFLAHDQARNLRSFVRYAQ